MFSRSRNHIWASHSAWEINVLHRHEKKKENGETEGMLYDSNGFRQLLFDTTAQNKG